jgi:exoribonuclease-2
MKSGTIVEYICDKQIVCGVVLDESPKKLRLLTEGNREVSLAEKRLIGVSRESVDISGGRDRSLHQLAEVVSRREALQETIDVFEIWEFLNEDERWFDARTIAEMYFGDNPSEDQISAMGRAFFEDRIYFKFDTNRFYPRTVREADELSKRRKEEEKRERMLEAGGKWLRDVMETGGGSAPPVRDELIETLKSFYIFGKESPYYRLGRDLLDRAGFNSRDLIFDILVKSGVWTPNENLLLIEHDIPEAFSKEGLDETGRVCHDGGTPDYEIGPERVDLTGLSTLTIDGEGTLDYDDALSIEPDGDAFRVWVHVTDVAHFIPPGSVLDQEAMDRASSIYMADKKVPMLPPQISEQLCSLRFGEKKPALSLMMKLDRSGRVLEFDFLKSVICINRQLTYYDANIIYKEDKELASLYMLALEFCRQREITGALQLTLPELHISVDEEERVSINRINRESPSRTTVAEFMIMANWLAGRFLSQKRMPGIYRSQGEPRKRLLGEEGGTLLENWQQRRCIARVVISAEPDRHSGLGLDVYSSWTSPIRKYLDLVTQRQLKRAAGTNSSGYTKNEVSRIIQAVEDPMRRLMSAQRKRARYWLLRYLEQRKGEKIQGLVVEKRHERYMILLPDIMLETSLPTSCGADSMPGDTVFVVIENCSARLDTLSVSLSENRQKNRGHAR